MLKRRSFATTGLAMAAVSSLASTAFAAGRPIVVFMGNAT